MILTILVDLSFLLILARHQSKMVRPRHSGSRCLKANVLCGLPRLFRDKKNPDWTEYTEAYTVVMNYRSPHRAVVVVEHPTISVAVSELRKSLTTVQVTHFLGLPFGSSPYGAATNDFPTQSCIHFPLQ